MPPTSPPGQNHPAGGSSGRRRLGLTVLAIGALFAGLLLIQSRYQKPPPPPPPAEVLRKDLTLRDGRFYQSGATNPFSGIVVELYQDGKTLARSSVSNGLLNGVSEGWHTNGQRQIIEHFKDGVSDGLRLKWFENGTNQSEAAIIQGKIEGTFRRWHENGQLAEQIEMKDGKPDGVALAYYPSGFLKARTRVEGGKTIDQKTWEDGQLKAPPPDAPK